MSGKIPYVSMQIRLISVGLLLAGFACTPAQAAGSAGVVDHSSSLTIVYGSFVPAGGTLTVMTPVLSALPPSSGGPSPAPPSPMPAFNSSGALVVPSPTAAAQGNSQTSGQDWGDPLGTDLLDTDGAHARLNVYMDNNKNGSQQGVGISVTFPE